MGGKDVCVGGEREQSQAMGTEEEAGWEICKVHMNSGDGFWGHL